MLLYTLLLRFTDRIVFGSIWSGAFIRYHDRRSDMSKKSLGVSIHQTEN